MKIIQTTAIIDRKGWLIILCALQQELNITSKTETHAILTDTPHCLSEAWNSLLQKSDESKNYWDTEDGKNKPCFARRADRNGRASERRQD